ncbi:MAG TPA: DNA-binding protein [Clostridiales bacterium]|jgi:predicted DNA-binding protein YlxM (UPF0122 family)|nr:DNA-binding protein [Clostridiales bacterium]
MEKEKRFVKKITQVVLFSFYGKMLTCNQQRLVSLYTEEDLSPAEIAEQLGISRQAAFDGINQAFKRLTRFEDKLHLVERFERLQKHMGTSLELLKKVEPRSGSEEYLRQAKESIKSLMESEGIDGGV